jgi:DNA-binding PadR family transcriptional regulator
MNRCGPRGPFDKRAVAAMMMAGWGRRGGSEWGSEFGGESWGQGRGGPGRRNRGRMFGTGELRLALLGLIAETPRHGYELIKAIEELSGGNYAPSPGVVYPTLSLLTDEAAIEQVDEPGVRRAYAITETGRKELDERADDFKAIVDRLTALAQEDERHSAPPLKRALGNLFTAVRQRAMAGGFDRETMLQVAELLDEAARKIERL